MNTERLIHMPECSTIDLSALCNSSNSIWKTIESHRWVKFSCENIGMCLSCVPFTLVIRLINCWDFIQIWYDNKILSSQWDNDNQHFVFIIVSWYLLGIITRQGFLFSCSCMNRCTCGIIKQNSIGYNTITHTTIISSPLAHEQKFLAISQPHWGDVRSGSWCLKSQETGLFSQQLLQANNKEMVKTSPILERGIH